MNVCVWERVEKEWDKNPSTITTTTLNFISLLVGSESEGCQISLKNAKKKMDTQFLN